jgi:hypothetical protein
MGKYIGNKYIMVVMDYATKLGRQGCYALTWQWLQPNSYMNAF